MIYIERERERERERDAHMAPYRTCELVQSTVRISTMISKEKKHGCIEGTSVQFFRRHTRAMISKTQPRKLNIYKAQPSEVWDCLRFSRLSRARCAIYCVFECSTEQSMVFPTVLAVLFHLELQAQSNIAYIGIDRYVNKC